ncbi:MAG: type II toxin-antitoxin system HipA family toxin [Gammaproteobacteria bacterium]|nr:type II toxin-antitoxin system HipA family toxin [Gammaproteobacteria bacterium]
MGRPSKTRQLGIWMNGALVGLWTVTSQGQHELSYEPAWLESSTARPLSLSLPLQEAGVPHRGAAVAYFFDNLLPDSLPIRRRLRDRFGASSTDAFDLLNEIGRDCVGAVQLVPHGDAPPDVRHIKGEVLTEADVAKVLRDTAHAPALGQEEEEGFRISIAGAQEKTALLWHDGQWHRPTGATPTTHILKLPLGLVGNMKADLTTSVENEWLSMTIARGYGLPTADCEMATFEDQHALVVTRFDRRLATRGTEWWIRLPQEDFCQATSTPADKKYERDGGPGVVDVMDILRNSRTPDGDRLTFFKSQMLFWLLAAPDGHAKNFSIFIEPAGRYRLTPLYDILSAHPLMGKGANQIAPQNLKLAMALRGKNRHYKWATIQPRHWLSTAKACGLTDNLAMAAIAEMVEATPAVVDEATARLPRGFPSQVADSILAGLAHGADSLRPLL